MLALQDAIKSTKLVDFPGLNVTKYHKILVPSLASAYQMNCLPLNVGQIMLQNHAGPKGMVYGSLLTQYIADQTKHNGPESQSLALSLQLVELSNSSKSHGSWSKRALAVTLAS